MASIDLAISEIAVGRMFNILRDSVHLTKSGSSSGAFSASYNVGVRLGGGRLDLKDTPDEIKISELNIIYDPLNVTLNVDIPEVCIGGFCIIPNPFGGCLVRAPRICIFTSNPDISIPLNLDGIIQSEISGGFGVETRYFDNPASTAMDVYAAATAGLSDAWRFHLKSRWLDIDLIDVSDTIGNLLDGIIDNFINGIFGGLPGWARDVLGWLLHGISDIIRTILDIGDDLDEWISDLLGISFGIFDFIANAVANYFLNEKPLYQFDNPYPILAGAPPVLINVASVITDITNDELILSVEI